MSVLGIEIATGLTVFAVSFGLLARLWRAIDIDARRDREARLVQAREFMWKQKMAEFDKRLALARAKHRAIRPIQAEREQFTRGRLEGAAR